MSQLQQAGNLVACCVRNELQGTVNELRHNAADMGWIDEHVPGIKVALETAADTIAAELAKWEAREPTRTV